MKLLLIVLFAAVSVAHCQQPSGAKLPVQSTYTHKTTFAVDAVMPATQVLPTEDYKTLMDETYVKSILISEKYAHEGQPDYVEPARRLESCSRDRRPVSGVQTNGFFETIHEAYGNHFALVLTPDMVWLAISQGFARHVNQNGEAMRHYFVQHDGKKVLDVNFTGKIKLGDDNSDWEWAFGQFHDSIAANTSPELAELIAGRFSGTGSDAAVAFDITLMDAMKTYFDYWGHILCGIPEITLEGTPEDWQQVEQRAAQLAKYDLDWWIQDLQPILAEFTLAAQGKPRAGFWKSMVKDVHEPICGGDTYITGWIVRFFPYVKKGDVYVRNPIIGLKTEDLYQTVPEQTVLAERSVERTEKDGPAPTYYAMCEGKKSTWVQYIGPKVNTDEIPSGISTAILNVDDNGILHKMELKAGFMGTRQDSVTNALRPVIGWVVVETGEKPDADVVERYLKHKREKH